MEKQPTTPLPPLTNVALEGKSNLPPPLKNAALDGKKTTYRKLTTPLNLGGYLLDPGTVYILGKSHKTDKGITGARIFFCFKIFLQNKYIF